MQDVGSYDLIAKCALAKEDAPNIVFPDTMIRARLKDTVLSEYVSEVVQTPLGRSFFQSNARTAVGMWKIGGEDIANFPIPIPPLQVQLEIIEHINNARAEIAREREALEKLCNNIKAEIEAMILGTKAV